ncbi:MAG: asparaginase [candidate division Zixibacteria bacterium]
MNYCPEPVARVLRGEVVESVHQGSAAVVDAEGRLLYRVGDPYLITFLRSSAKPFQAVAVVASGAAKEFAFSSTEIAIMAGSHSGEEKHIEAVSSILDKIGLGHEHLKCGTHPPLKDILPKGEQGQARTVIHHNCSGKHAGMLALAVFKNLSIDDYISPTHPVQQLITRTVAEICVYPEGKIGIAIDGCSVPNHALPLYNMALGYARMVTPNAVPREKAQAYNSVAMAMMEHPDYVAGEGRFDTVLSGSPGEKIISKAGAEALECFSFVERKLGAAVKINDGAKRGLFPFSVELLYKLGARSRSEKLDEFHRPVIKNWRGLEVGRIEPGFEIGEVDHE